MPSNVNNKNDTYSPLVMTLSLVFGKDTPPIPGKSPGTKATEVVIPTQDYVQGFTIENKGGAWTGNLDLFDQAGDLLENLLMLGGQRRRAVLRWGWDDGRPMTQFPVYTADVILYKPDFNEQGIKVSAQLITAGCVDVVTDKVSRSFGTGYTYSGIVREIAKARGWKTDIGGKSTIETTDKAPAQPKIQKDASDIKFIQDLLAEAVTNDGEHYTFFFDSDGVMHFHSRLYMVKQFGEDKRIKASYVFARDLKGDVISFQPEDTTVFGVLMGGGDTEYDAIDSLNGTRIEINTKIEGGGDEGTKQNVQPTEQVRPAYVSLRQARQTIDARTEEDMRNKVQAKYSKLQSMFYVATLSVRGTHAVAPFEHIEVRYIKKDGTDHYLSGVFQVYEVNHEVSSSGWTTTFRMGKSATKAVQGIEIKPVKNANVTRMQSGGSTQGIVSTTGNKPPTDNSVTKTAKPG
jgi:hypothetical protein